MPGLIRRAALAAGFAAAAGSAAVAAPDTLSAVKARGHLVCGVSQGLPGFSIESEKGQWSGLDVDFCRALAAAGGSRRVDG